MTRINDTFRFEEPWVVEDDQECIFYHVMDLPGLGTTDGPWDLRGKFDDYIGQVDVAGRSILDIGAASGFLTFEAEKRGATVVSFDISDGKYQTLIPFVNKEYSRDHASWARKQTEYFAKWKRGYWLAHRLLGSSARAFYGNIHEIPQAVGIFDIAFMGSVLEHLNDPISALASTSRVVESTLIITTDMIDTGETIARFEPRAGNSDQDYTWWTYSLGTYREVLGILGFEVARVTKAEFRFTHTDTMAERYSIVAERVVPLK